MFATHVHRQPQALDGSEVVDCCKVAQGEGELLLSTAPKAAPVQSVSVLSAADALIEANSPVRRGWDFCTFDLWGVKLRQYRSNDDKYIHRPRIRPGLLLFESHWNIRAFSSPFLSRNELGVPGISSLTAHAVGHTAETSIHGLRPRGFIPLPTGRISVAELAHHLQRWSRRSRNRNAGYATGGRRVSDGYLASSSRRRP